MLAELHATLAWRASMMLSAITGPLFILINAAVWKGFFMTSETGVIGGFTYEGMVTYFAIVVLIGYLTWNDQEYNLSEDIEKGTLSQYLLKPHSFFRWQLYKTIMSQVVAFGLEFLPTLLVILLLGVPFTVSNPGWFAVFIVLAFFINYCMNNILGMLGFWLTKPRGLLWTWTFVKGLLFGMTIPLSVFPAFYQTVISYTPFPYFVYIPARVAMGLPVTVGGHDVSIPFVLAIGILNALLLYGINRVLWARGVKRYTGVGQ